MIGPATCSSSSCGRAIPLQVERFGPNEHFWRPGWLCALSEELPAIDVFLRLYLF